MLLIRPGHLFHRSKNVSGEQKKGFSKSFLLHNRLLLKTDFVVLLAQMTVMHLQYLLLPLTPFTLLHHFNELQMFQRKSLIFQLVTSYFRDCTLREEVGETERDKEISGRERYLCSTCTKKGGSSGRDRCFLYIQRLTGALEE